MATVNSVLGPIDSSKLGFTLMHEHILVASADLYHVYPELMGENRMERTVEALRKAKEGGVDTIVDATTLDLGRNLDYMIEASRRSGVNIIACSGWWLEIPRFFAGVSANQLADVFAREVDKGIAGTSVKAGILKSAADIAGVPPDIEIVLRAVARAHRKTGAPIMLHSYSPGQVGRQQIAILKDEGVNLKHVKMDHSNDTTDVEYLRWMMDQGCYLGLDRYPGRNTTPDARTRTMKALIDAGYAAKLCPSHDGSALRVMAANPAMSEEERLRLNPHGYLYIKKVVLPELRRMGVPGNIVEGLCVTGPRNFFEGN